MVNTYELDNGVQVVIDKRDDVYSAHLGIFVKAGTRDENEAIYGCGHFLEHMFFKGTKAHTAEELAQLLDALGGHMNAYTSYDFTCFYGSVLKEDLMDFLSILEEMLFNSTFSGELLDGEKKVILEEYEMYQDDPSSLSLETFSEYLFKGTSLAHNILGTRESISQLKRDDLTDFYSEHYTGNNMVIVLTGAVEDRVIEEVEQRFGKVKRGTAEKSMANIPLERSFKPVTIIKDNLQQINFSMGCVGLSRNHEDYYYLQILSHLLGGSSSSYLFQRLREDLGLCYDINTFVSTFYETGQLMISGGTREDNFLELLHEIRVILGELIVKGVDEVPFLRGKKQIVTQMLLGDESLGNRMSRWGQQIIYRGKLIPIEEHKRIIENLSLEGLNTFIKWYLKPEHMSLCCVMPREIKELDEKWGQWYEIRH